MGKLKVLLVEPSYKCKYPPLGLMKLSAFHKKRGDEVVFVKGTIKEKKDIMWDRIYISTLFSFYWDLTIRTIDYYEFSVKDPRNFYIGGPMATIMAEEIKDVTGFIPVQGLLNKEGQINLPNEQNIDNMIPDYNLLNQISYKYLSDNAYFSYTTRGCIRKCPFCAVPKIEPLYQEYVPLSKQIKSINLKYGRKKDLLLLDNNILASSCFEKIIDEIKEIGFFKGAKLNGISRYVDFNQGIDLRKLSKQKMKLLAEISIRPLRIAFDDIRLKEQYIKAIEMAAEYGILNLSNYILYNYNDTPKDFFERLKINVDLNERLGTKIFSFPMKYIPVTNKDRLYVGTHWNPRFLRGIQCILHVTHGVVGPNKSFFEAAFGKNYSDFKKILLMPDSFIMYRESRKKNKVKQWQNILNNFSNNQRSFFMKNILQNSYSCVSNDKLIKKIISFYKEK
ncbi:MAG: hypothetical protein LBC76_00115 [Treponema sp.]|jgi:radical SAM superfamily enzyme YgiQ (UPF0313 family)|nr:hypothetical protein [Treponema sp.]